MGLLTASLPQPYSFSPPQHVSHKCHALRVRLMTADVRLTPHTIASASHTLAAQRCSFSLSVDSLPHRSRKGTVEISSAQTWASSQVCLLRGDCRQGSCLILPCQVTVCIAGVIDGGFRVQVIQEPILLWQAIIISRSNQNM